MQKLIAVSLFSVLLVGCASMGNPRLRNETDVTVSGKIVEGVSTKTDIKSAFGAPESVIFSGNDSHETWSYEFQKVTPDLVSYIPIVNFFGIKSSGQKKQLTVLFDARGLVKRYSLNETNTCLKTGLFS